MIRTIRLIDDDGGDYDDLAEILLTDPLAVSALAAFPRIADAVCGDRLREMIVHRPMLHGYDDCDPTVQVDAIYMPSVPPDADVEERWQEMDEVMCDMLDQWNRTTMPRWMEYGTRGIGIDWREGE